MVSAPMGKPRGIKWVSGGPSLLPRLQACHQVSNCPLSTLLPRSFIQIISDLGLPAGVHSPLTSDGFTPHTPPHSSSQKPSLTLALFASTLYDSTRHSLKPRLLTRACKIPLSSPHASCLLHTDTHTHSHPGSGSHYLSRLQMTEVSANPWISAS